MNRTLSCLAVGLALFGAPALAREAPGDARVAPPPPGKAQVVFFRPDDFLGMFNAFTVKEGKAVVARLSNEQYYIVVADPGVHTYLATSFKNDTLTLELDEGETYYVREELEAEAFGSRMNLTPSDAITFSIFPWLKLAKPPEASRQRARRDR